MCRAFIILRKLTSSFLNPDMLYTGGIIPVVLNLTAPKHPLSVRVHATWTLLNLLNSENEIHIQSLEKLGVLAVLFELLDEPYPTLNEHAIAGLSNYVATGDVYRRRALEGGVVEKIKTLVEIPKMPVCIKRALIFLICNVLNSEALPEVSEIRPLIDFATECLWSEDPLIISDSLWTITSLLSSPRTFSAVSKTPVIAQLILRTKASNAAIRRPALRCIGILSAGDNSVGLRLTQLGVFEALEGVLGSQSEKLIREACWTVANLLACGPGVVGVCVEKGILAHARLLVKTSNRVIAEEAMWVIYTALISGSEEQMEGLVQLGVIEDLGMLLKTDDVSIQGNALKILEEVMERAKSIAGQTLYKEMVNRLDESSGAESLEVLRFHKNEEISKMANRFIKEHYRMEEVECSLLFDPHILT